MVPILFAYFIMHLIIVTMLNKQLLTNIAKMTKTMPGNHVLNPLNLFPVEIAHTHL